MNFTDYYEKTAFPVTICNEEGIIIYMNVASQNNFAKRGGKDLIGKSLFDCHNENSGRIIRELIENDKTNTYFLEKDGVKRLIHQTPWYKDEKVAGLIELIIPVQENKLK